MWYSYSTKGNGLIPIYEDYVTEIAVVEVQKEENTLGKEVALQVENYAATPQNWYGLWFPKQISLVYLANGKKLYYKNMLEPDSDHIEIPAMHTPRIMVSKLKR